MDDQRKRRRVRLFQKYVTNPPVKLGVYAGVVPGHAILETTGRKSGKTRRTIVGVHEDEGALWVVAEQGRHAAYVKNLEANPAVRIRQRGRWQDGVATVVDADDPKARLERFGRPRHAEMVRRFGTSLLSVRIEMSGRE